MASPDALREDTVVRILLPVSAEIWLTLGGWIIRPCPDFEAVVPSMLDEPAATSTESPPLAERTSTSPEATPTVNALGVPSAFFKALVLKSVPRMTAVPSGVAISRLDPGFSFFTPVMMSPYSRYPVVFDFDGSDFISASLSLETSQGACWNSWMTSFDDGATFITIPFSKASDAVDFLPVTTIWPCFKIAPFEGS